MIDYREGEAIYCSIPFAYTRQAVDVKASGTPIIAVAKLASWDPRPPFNSHD